MTENELKELLEDAPTLYHMAEAGSWDSIRARGLMSTTALLDLYKVFGERRKDIEGRRRPENVVIKFEGLPPAVIRDQLPMDDVGLQRALPKHLSPEYWYRNLNAKVFFWLTRARLEKLLSAKSYRDKRHDVLELNTAALIDAYREKIWFCPINSGCTKPMPHPRDASTFLRISEYPYSDWSKKRKRGERVVELAVDSGVPDVAHFVRRVTSMRQNHVLDVIYSTD